MIGVLSVRGNQRAVVRNVLLGVLAFGTRYIDTDSVPLVRESKCPALVWALGLVRATSVFDRQLLYFVRVCS